MEMTPMTNLADARANLKAAYDAYEAATRSGDWEAIDIADMNLTIAQAQVPHTFTTYMRVHTSYPGVDALAPWFEAGRPGYIKIDSTTDTGEQATRRAYNLLTRLKVAGALQCHHTIPFGETPVMPWWVE